MTNEKETRERMDEVRRKIEVMEWDRGRNQFNPGKIGMYNELKEELEKLQAELNSAVSVTAAQNPAENTDVKEGEEQTGDDLNVK